MHTECRNAVEDGADGCFLLREEWGFPVILSEAERRMARKSDKQTTTGEKTDGRAVASLGTAGASAPFAARPPLREAVRVAGRTGGAGHRAKSEPALRSVSCFPAARAIGVFTGSVRRDAPTDRRNASFDPPHQTPVRSKR